MYEQISQAMTSPQELEQLYQRNPQEFRKQFLSVFNEHPDSIILQVWHERLFFQEKNLSQNESTTSKIPFSWLWIKKELLLVAVLSLFAGTLLKLPHWINNLDDGVFYLRNLSSIILGTLAIYFLSWRAWAVKRCLIIFCLGASVIFYINLLPHIEQSQTILLASLHIPIFFWSLLGLAFTGNRWRTSTRRWEFLRYNGEMVIYSSLLYLGGMVLTILTIMLFELIQIHIERLYFDTIGVYGGVAIPLVATFIIEQIANRHFRIAPILSKIFTPLFLITITIYLVTIVLAQENPYIDRDCLMVFNILLVVVLGLTVFSISERQQGAERLISDYLTYLLIALTLLLDLIVLSAIVFRLSSYGFTPNRLAVLGANLCIFGHLAGIVYYYGRFMRKKEDFRQLIVWITNYIPVYTVWSIVVIFGFPAFFRFGHLNP